MKIKNNKKQATSKTNHRASHRNYRREYDLYYGKKGSNLKSLTLVQRKHRKEKTARNKARSILSKTHKLGPEVDVDHKDNNPLNNDPENLQLMSKHLNRGLKNEI